VINVFQFPSAVFKVTDSPNMVAEELLEFARQINQKNTELKLLEKRRMVLLENIQELVKAGKKNAP